jgi:hypothetical protein
MSEIDRLHTQYIERYLMGGDTDPSDLLAELEGEQREELAELIDAFLVDAPARPWNETGFEGSGAEKAVDVLVAQGTLWPFVLPGLRERLQIKRKELAKQLAEALGHSDQREKVERYYHQMETGQLDPEGVTDPALEALGRILGRNAETLRQMGKGLGPPTSEVKALAYTRLTVGDTDAAPGMASTPQPPEEGWDEVDELFRGRTKG